MDGTKDVLLEVRHWCTGNPVTVARATLTRTPAITGSLPFRPCDCRRRRDIRGDRDGWHQGCYPGGRPVVYPKQPLLTPHPLEGTASRLRVSRCWASQHLQTDCYEGGAAGDHDGWHQGRTPGGTPLVYPKPLLTPRSLEDTAASTCKQTVVKCTSWACYWRRAIRVPEHSLTKPLSRRRRS